MFLFIITHAFSPFSFSESVFPFCYTCLIFSLSVDRLVFDLILVKLTCDLTWTRSTDLKTALLVDIMEQLAPNEPDISKLNN